MQFTRPFLAAMLVVFASAAGAQGIGTPASATSAAGKSALPLVNAEVRKIDQGKGMIVLRHGEIPNLGMPAMTMAFDVPDKKMLSGVKPGDKVTFRADMIQGKATVLDLKPMR